MLYLKNCNVQCIMKDINLFFLYIGGLNVTDHMLQLRKYSEYKNILFSQHSIRETIQTLLLPI